MILYYSALYSEAKAIIKRLNLKKDITYKSHELYRSESTLLLVGGIGKLKAAIACTKLLEKLKSEIILNDIIFCNIGIAGCADSSTINNCYLINQIEDIGSKRRYYPELLLRHKFKEASLSTSDSPVHFNNIKEENDLRLYDMEASGCFVAVNCFLTPAQSLFFKIVSDTKEESNVTKEKVESLIEAHWAKIHTYLESVENVFLNTRKTISKTDKKSIDLITTSLSLSYAEKIELTKLAKAYIIRNKSNLNFLNKFNLNHTNKEQAKEVYARVKKQLFS